jgi:hypothetical protein
MIGSQNAECKDVHTVGFPSFSHAGEQGSAKNPPKGGRSFADFYVAAEATTHKEFRAERQNPHPSQFEECGTRNFYPCRELT